jgi:V8-like Glu-specific endopeptidase
MFLATAIAAAMGVQSLAADLSVSPMQPRYKIYTEQERVNALPMPLLEARGAPTAAASAAPAGAPGQVSGKLPLAERAGAAAATVVTGQGVKASPEIGTGSTVWYDYPPPSTLYPQLADQASPHKALGRLFFTDGVFNYACSAQSVSTAGTWGAGNSQMVVTAGHCCSDGAGAFYSGWEFVPAYRNGSAPFGTWTGAIATVFTVWHETGDFSRDICALQMNTNGGQNIQDVVGALGYAWNQTLPQQYHATGWPAEPPFNGSRLMFVAASDAETDTSQAGDFAYTHGIGSVMTGGSSGGAWILNYKPFLAADGQLFNGLNSYKYTIPSRPAEMFGPYIDDAVINGLFEFVANAPAVP